MVGISIEEDPFVFSYILISVYSMYVGGVSNTIIRTNHPHKRGGGFNLVLSIIFCPPKLFTFDEDELWI
jgi:hypothetical protein